LGKKKEGKRTKESNVGRQKGGGKERNSKTTTEEKEICVSFARREEIKRVKGNVVILQT